MRVRFLEQGGQRKFLAEVVSKLNSPSLRGLLQFGFDVKYSTLKSYYEERRLMSEYLVLEFCDVSGIEFGSLDVEVVGENWGKVNGGRKSKRNKLFGSSNIRKS